MTTTCAQVRVRCLGRVWDIIPAPPGNTLREQLDQVLADYMATVPELIDLGLDVDDLDVFWLGDEDGIAAYHESVDWQYILRAHPA